MHQNFIRATAAAAVAATFSSAAVAGGFQLTEQSALGLGRAYAGMGVDGTDVSGLYYNPATMTLHTGTQAQFGFVGVGLNLDYNAKDGGSDHDENGRKHPEAVPNLFISHQINDVTWIGFGFTVPYSASPPNTAKTGSSPAKARKPRSRSMTSTRPLPGSSPTRSRSVPAFPTST